MGQHGAIHRTFLTYGHEKHFLLLITLFLIYALYSFPVLFTVPEFYAGYEKWHILLNIVPEKETMKSGLRAKQSILSHYLVDKVPNFIRPQFFLYGYGLGLFLFLFFLVLRITTKVESSGREKLRKDSNHIFCLWHSFVPAALISATPLIPAVLDRAPQAWMQHPFWYIYVTTDNFAYTHDLIERELG